MVIVFFPFLGCTVDLHILCFVLLFLFLLLLLLLSCDLLVVLSEEVE